MIHCQQLETRIVNWALVSIWVSSAFEQNPTLENVSENIWIQGFLYICLSKQWIDNITALVRVRGLLLAQISWGFAVCSSVDNMRPNLDILLTTALFAGFRPLGNFNFLDHYVHVQKALRSWDRQSGYRTKSGHRTKIICYHRKQRSQCCHYKILFIPSYMGEEVILFTYKELIPSYRTMKSELFTKFTTKLQTHTIEPSTFLITNSV